MKRTLLPLLLCACQTYPEGPAVQPSHAPPPTSNVVPIPKEGGWGVPCLTIEVGQTVEWRNYAPAVPVNVTSLADPPELYSPSLVAPLPTVAKDATGPYVYWRHTFQSPGVFEYYDTTSGDPGKKVVDPYYGTVSYVGLSPSLVTGIVCVREAGSKQCRGVCCVQNGDGDDTLFDGECGDGQCCDPLNKRCLHGSPSLQVCAGKPVHRSLACFRDAHCKAGESCAIQPKANHTCH
jgi:hypothetical protein